MSAYQTPAVVIGAKNWGNADRMVTLFTRERGLVKAAAFGSRRPRSPLAAAMQIFAVVDAQLAEGKRVDTVRQCTLVSYPHKLTEDLVTMAYGGFIAEFLREFLPEGQPEPDMFDRTLLILQAFETRNPRITALAAAYQLMEFTGLQLQYDACVRCGRPIEGDAFFQSAEGGVICRDCHPEGAHPFPTGLREFIRELRTLDWQNPAFSSVSKANLVRAEYLLKLYLQELLGHPMRSWAFIEQVGM